MSNSCRICGANIKPPSKDTEVCTTCATVASAPEFLAEPSKEDGVTDLRSAEESTPGPGFLSIPAPLPPMVGEEFGVENDPKSLSPEETNSGFVEGSAEASEQDLSGGEAVQQVPTSKQPQPPQPEVGPESDGFFEPAALDTGPIPIPPPVESRIALARRFFARKWAALRADMPNFPRRSLLGAVRDLSGYLRALPLPVKGLAVLLLVPAAWTLNASSSLPTRGFTRQEHVLHNGTDLQGRLIKVALLERGEPLDILEVDDSRALVRDGLNRVGYLPLEVISADLPRSTPDLPFTRCERRAGESPARRVCRACGHSKNVLCTVLRRARGRTGLFGALRASLPGLYCYL